MGPIEAMWGMLIIVFTLVGLVRGFLKELGVLTVLIVALFGLDLAIPRLENLINGGVLGTIGIAPLNPPVAGTHSTELLLWFIFSVLIVLVVFISYQGETLSFEGTPPGFPIKTLLSALVGFVNGYLITGSLWWILNRYHYPPGPNIIDPDFLTPFAQSIINNKLLPFDLLGNGGTIPQAGLGTLWLPLILMALIILKVLR
jgi:Colicin V production protein